MPPVGGAAAGDSEVPRRCGRPRRDERPVRIRRRPQAGVASRNDSPPGALTFRRANSCDTTTKNSGM